MKTWADLNLQRAPVPLRWMMLSLIDQVAFRLDVVLRIQTQLEPGDEPFLKRDVPGIEGLTFNQNSDFISLQQDDVIFDTFQMSKVSLMMMGAIQARKGEPACHAETRRYFPNLQMRSAGFRFWHEQGLLEIDEGFSLRSELIEFARTIDFSDGNRYAELVEGWDFDETKWDEFLIEACETTPVILLGCHERFDAEIVERLVHDFLERGFDAGGAIACILASKVGVALDSVRLEELINENEVSKDNVNHVVALYRCAMETAPRDDLVGALQKYVEDAEMPLLDLGEDLGIEIPSIPMGINGLTSITRLLLEQAPRQALGVVNEGLRGAIQDAAPIATLLGAIRSRWAIEALLDALKDLEKGNASTAIISVLEAVGDEKMLMAAREIEKAASEDSVVAMAKFDPGFDEMDLALSKLMKSAARDGIDGLSDWGQKVRDAYDAGR